MTHNEQDVERVAKAIYTARHGDPDDWARDTEAVRDRYRSLARAALDVMGIPSREQVEHALMGIVSPRMMPVASDAILALLATPAPQTVGSVWRCDFCNYPNEDGDSEYARCAICGGEDFTQVATTPMVETAATHVCGEMCTHRSDCGLHNAPACYEPGGEAMTDTHDCTPAPQTVGSVEAAVAFLAPLVTNETQAWNIWNAINGNEAFVTAFMSLHTPAATPCEATAEQVEAALIREWHQDQCACRECDGLDLDTCYTRREVFGKLGTYAGVMMPPMTWTVEAVLSAAGIEVES
jgi:hypothetical protein